MDRLRHVAPGLLVSVVVAAATRFLSEQYGAPAMLMALLLGLAFHFLSEEGRCAEGIAFTARTVLRLGVALLGVRISLELLSRPQVGSGRQWPRADHRRHGDGTLWRSASFLVPRGRRRDRDAGLP